MKRQRSKRRAQLQSSYLSLWERFLAEPDPEKREALANDAALVRRGFDRRKQPANGGAR